MELQQKQTLIGAVLQTMKRGSDTIIIGKESENIDMGCLPIGLRDTWRIWKILESIGTDGKEGL